MEKIIEYKDEAYYFLRRFGGKDGLLVYGSGFKRILVGQHGLVALEFSVNDKEEVQNVNR